MAKYVSNKSREWTKTNDIEEKKKNTNEVYEPTTFDIALEKVSAYILQMLKTLTEEEQAVISSRKLSTIIQKSKTIVKND